MTRPRLARALIPLLAILALAVCLVCSGQRARAAGDASAKKPAAAKTTPGALVQGHPATKAVTPKSVPSVSAPVVAAIVQDTAPEQAGKAEAMALKSLPPPPSSAGSAEPAIEHVGKASTEEPDLTAIPVAGGLPVMVNIGVFVVELQAFDDVKGEFEATTDLRLRWMDPRLRFRGTGAVSKYVEYRGKEAEERLGKLWVPNVDVANRAETSGYVGRRLRLFSDGQIETIVRSTGRYKIDVNVQNFPFDVQSLKQTMVVRDQTTDEVMLHFDREDEEFSRAAADVAFESWQIGDVDLDADLAGGWNGDRYARVTASLLVKRATSTGLTTIFIPLLASLLIPLLTLWMNRATHDGFEIEAFELANMGIGGLFSVIALSFAVASSYSSIAGSDNTVTRLFALNYATLAISLGVVVLLFRGNLVLRCFGPYVHEQVFRFVLWAVPLLTLCTALSFVLVAAC